MQASDTLPGARTPRLALVIVASVYVLRGGVVWGSTAFLTAVITAALMTSQPIPHGTAMLAAYYTAALAFLFGSLTYARQVLDMTSPDPVPRVGTHSPRVWLWPFLVFGWVAVVFESPFILILGVFAEGYLVSQLGTITDAPL